MLLGRRIDLSPETVDAKLIDRRRGGYCFEQNSLLQRVLGAFGYRVEPLMARVLWMREPEAPPPAWSHMVLRVFVDGGGYLVDVGFGSCVPTAPLRFDRTTAQPTPHEPFRRSRTLDGYLLEAELGRDWVPVYEGSPRICGEDAYRIANIAASTHPQSLFRQNLLVTLTSEQARTILFANRLTIREWHRHTPRTRCACNRKCPHRRLRITLPGRLASDHCALRQRIRGIHHNDMT